uniref:Uncharacterized protein n=2 Tax=Arion vulgaris TaxID=1028688 RepID=A0A0B7A2G8_9EUPU
MMSRESTAILAVTAVVAVISLVNFGLILHNHLDHKNLAASDPSESKYRVCVPCKQLPLGAESTAPNKRLSRTYQDGVEHCCAKSQEQISAMLELIHQRQTNATGSVTYDPKHVISGQVSGHKRLLPIDLNQDTVPQFSNEMNVHLALDVSDTYSQREHANNVEAMQSGYHILASGIYYIYSSIQFQLDSSITCRQYNSQTWRQGVIRSRSNQRQDSGVLLTSVHSCCDDCTWDTETSYTGMLTFMSNM